MSAMDSLIIFVFNRKYIPIFYKMMESKVFAFCVSPNTSKKCRQLYRFAITANPVMSFCNFGKSDNKKISRDI